jgi:hypothetical protein
MAVWASDVEGHNDVVKAIGQSVMVVTSMADCIRVIQDQSNEVILTIVDDLLDCVDCDYIYSQWLGERCRDYEAIKAKFEPKN